MKDFWFDENVTMGVYTTDEVKSRLNGWLYLSEKEVPG